MKIFASETPNRGLESSFCCWTAGQGLAQKECLSHRHRSQAVGARAREGEARGRGAREVAVHDIVLIY